MFNDTGGDGEADDDDDRPEKRVSPEVRGADRRETGMIRLLRPERAETEQANEDHGGA